MSDAGLAERLVAILGELIAAPSAYPPGDSRAVCAVAARRLSAAGLAVETHSRITGVDNVVARLGTGSPSLVFTAHADTVGPGDPAAWSSDPFAAALREGRLYGLGAANCKGSMAVQIWLAEAMAARGGPERGSIAFAFVGDEERLGPDGLCFLRESGAIRPAMLVVGGPTDNQLITEERGVMWVRLTAHGKAAHAGEPAAGDNAILRMLRLLGALDSGLAPRLATRRAGAKLSTMNLGKIAGGFNTNVVPSSCTAEIDRRLLPAEDRQAALAEMRALLDAAGEPPGSWEIALTTGTNGFSARRDGPAVSAFAAAVEACTGRPARFVEAVGASDARWFADDGIELIGFGPGGGVGHEADESVAVAQLVEAARIQRHVVESLLDAR